MQSSVRASDSRSTRLAIIPARGGSKRVPKKNIRSLCGQPAIVYTIRAAVQSGLFRDVVVSTDCEVTAEIATNHGAVVPFLRGASLSDDHTPVSLVSLDALEKLDPGGVTFDTVAQLMPNCPLRDKDDILSSHRQFVATGAPSQISIVRFGWLNPWWALKLDEDFGLSPVFEDAGTKRSQDLPVLFCPTGAIWWASAATLRSERTFHVSDRHGWQIAWDHAVDIDTQDDWDMAEFLMARRLERRQV